MDRIVVQGGTRLTGEVAVSGSKNSTLALMAAALLAAGLAERLATLTQELAQR